MKLSAKTLGFNPHYWKVTPSWPLPREYSEQSFQCTLQHSLNPVTAKQPSVLLSGPWGKGESAAARAIDRHWPRCLFGIEVQVNTLKSQLRNRVSWKFISMGDFWIILTDNLEDGKGHEFSSEIDLELQFSSQVHQFP